MGKEKTEQEYRSEFYFSLLFRDEEIHCANICGFIPGQDTSSTILTGSHFDTPWIEDNKDDGTKNLPIPGVK